ncbi:hypothetical protein D9M73_205350 [compost metagenome]
MVTGFEFVFQPPHHLQDQTVAGLVPQCIVGMAKIVQVQVPERDAAPVMLGQARCEQRLEALAVGDASQRILLGQAL